MVLFLYLIVGVLAGTLSGMLGIGGGLVVVPALVGMKLQVYNGNKFVPVEITGEMLGCKFGEFAPTRAKIVHTTLGKKVTSVRK